MNIITPEEFGPYITKKLASINYSPVIPTIERIIQNSIDMNFSVGGRFGEENEFGGGAQKWKVSKRALKHDGQTLADSGQLAASIYVNVRQSIGGVEIEIGSNKPYAPIHQFGGTIQQAARSNLYTQNRYKRSSKKAKKGQFKKGTSYGQGSTSGARRISIPARPFLVLQNEDIEDIKLALVDFIRQTLSRELA